MDRILGKVVAYDTEPAPLVTRLVGRGYAVLTARDEAHLRAIAARERPDLVIGDLRVGDSTPVGVCRRFKTNLLLRHLPIVVVSHHKEVHSRVEAVNEGADDYLVEPCDDEELFARVARAIARARASLDANPLTRLPGNASIKAELDQRLARREPLAVLFVDLDHFKAFNDHYGFFRGDEALRVLSDIILEAVDSPGNGHTSDFAGNIGGDDFVVITTLDRAEPIAARICELVDSRMPYLYDEADRQAGHITSVDRLGQVRHFPLATVSVAIVTNEARHFRHHSQISQIGTEIKNHLKQQPGSNYLANRRRPEARSGGPLAAGPRPQVEPTPESARLSG
ncbi:MAG: diguanylate cyclase domain-containing protein [Candidatus Brocadiia bacterium]